MPGSHVEPVMERSIPLYPEISSGKIEGKEWEAAMIKVAIFDLAPCGKSAAPSSSKKLLNRDWK